MLPPTDDSDVGEPAGEHSGDGDVQETVKGRIKLRKLAGMVVPSLSQQKGKVKVPLQKTLVIVMSLYVSHSFSAWGDRMWGFAVSLLLVTLYPGSLLLPGIHGFLLQLTTAIFGTIIGDLVDYHPRFKVAASSLIVQNGFLSLSSVGMALMFYYDWGVCQNVLLFSILTMCVILLASGANLATVANTISIEKDWIVVIADGNADTLAVLNANMRRIDLCCKLTAPALTGVILQHAGPFSTTVIVAVWNVISFFGELSLLWIVYKLVPSLSVKKVRKESMKRDEDCDKDLTEIGSLSTEDEVLIDNEDPSDEISEDVLSTQKQSVLGKRRCLKQCLKLLSLFSTFKNGWRIYIRQDVALVGFAMASIYLTVLGFSGITSSYLLTQGLRNDLIGVFQGVGAILGVIGTILYPFLRKKFGTVRTGLFGISTQLLILLFCIAAIIVPSNRTHSEATGYYSPDCRNTRNYSVYGNETEGNQTIPTDATLSAQLYSSNAYEYSSVSTVPFEPYQNSTPSSYPNGKRGRNIALILILVGIVGCRIGLWIFDLAVQQLVQEKVVEEERGVVSGVMNAMIAIMDMLHYVLVIAAPRPEHFNILTGISFAMVFVGWMLYSAYVRKSRGHFFHCNDFIKWFQKKLRREVISGAEENVKT